MPTISRNLKPHQIAILGAGIASLVLVAVPQIQILMLPLQYLNTHIHELWHAIACVLTGGAVDHIEVHAAGDGVTPIRGGNIIAVGSAGYVGAAISGMAIMYFGRTEKLAKATLRALGVLLGISMLIWVRADAVGIASGVVWIGIMWALPRFAKGSFLLFTTQFIGLQQCLNAAQSLYILLRISAYSNMQSDAKILEQATYIPSIAWALGWCGFSLLMVFLGLRKAWSNPTPKLSR